VPATIEKKAACFTDSSAHLRQTGFLPLLALSYGYTAGGPFGYEEIFRASGPGMSLLFLMFVLVELDRNVLTELRLRRFADGLSAQLYPGSNR